MPPIKSTTLHTVASSNMLPTSGSLKIKPSTRTMNKPGMTIPRLSVGIWRWNRSQYQASATIRANLANSDGWNSEVLRNPSQRAASFLRMPMGGTNTSTSNITASANSGHANFFSPR